MCGWNPIRNLIETVVSLAGNYELPGSSLLTNNLVSKGSQNQLNSPIGQVAQIASGAAGSGTLGAGLQSGGGAAEQSALNNIFNSVSPSITSGANSVGGLFGAPTLGTDIGQGISDINSGVSSGLSRFADSTGLSSLFGGTPQSEGAFTQTYNNLFQGGASPENALAAQSPATSPAFGAPLSVGNAAASGAGGGASGAGFNLAGSGESNFLPSASGIGDTSALFNPGLFSDNAANTIGSQFGIPAASEASLAVPVPANGFTGTVGNPITASSGGTNAMGNLSSLYGAGSGNGGTSNGGANLLNGLLRSGLSGLFNNTNQEGYQGLENAASGAANNYRPFLESGTAANNTLASLYGNNGNGAQAAAQANWQNTPGYQFALQQGMNAINANAARMGQTLSGNNQQAIQRFGTGLADQTYNNYINNLQQQAGQGMSAAGGVGTANLLGANAAGQGRQARANNQNISLGGALQALFPQQNNTNNNYSGLAGLFG